jgi:hypothetical protein
MSEPGIVKSAAKQERKLIAAEEKATRLLLDAQSKHERALKKLAKSEKRAQTTAATLIEAETNLAAARSARATGP